jgi:uncharacterized membrane protein YjgN (DUF898 family)
MNIKSANPSPLQKTNYLFYFRGNTDEYFKIWIVNIFLTIITFGVYSAWAKVRTNKYIYGNTYLDDTAFDYTADAISILKGRIIAATAIGVYLVTTKYYPMSFFLFAALFSLVTPWLVVRAMQFRLRKTSYRNIRFNFTGTYGEAASVFVGLMMLIPFTFGLIYPYIVSRRNHYLYNNCKYGTTQFFLNVKTQEFYSIYFVAVILLLLTMTISSAVTPRIDPNLLGEEGRNIFTVNNLLFLPLYLFIYVYTFTNVKNLIWNNLRVNDFHFNSSLKTGKIFSIYSTNLLAIVATCGLAVPWAQIRTIRYRLEQLSLYAASELNGFIADSREEVSATGEGLADVFDVDIGI